MYNDLLRPCLVNYDVLSLNGFFFSSSGRRFDANEQFSTKQIFDNGFVFR